MRTDPTYEELAGIIARYVHDHLHHEEMKVDGTKLWIVDNMASSSYQIATGVLNRLDILTPLDEAAQRNRFSCAPDEFADVIARNKDKGCSYDALILALICLLEQDERPELRDTCIELGLCEPAEAPAIEWTAKAEPYRALYKDWPRLLDE